MTAILDIAAQGLALLGQANTASLTTSARRLGAIAGSLMRTPASGVAWAPITRPQRIARRWLLPTGSPGGGSLRRAKGGGVVMRGTGRASVGMQDGHLGALRRPLAAGPAGTGRRMPATNIPTRLIALARSSTTPAAGMRRRGTAQSSSGSGSWIRPMISGQAAGSGRFTRATGTMLPPFATRLAPGKSGWPAQALRSPTREAAGDTRSFAPLPRTAQGDPAFPAETIETPASRGSFGSRAPMRGADSDTPLGGTLHLDGDALGQFVTRHLERALTGAQRGPTGIDPRAVPIWGSASAGF